QLNFDLFMDDAGIPLCQKYKMVRVSSTANIPEVKSLDLKSAKTASLYGGIDYKNTSENAVAGNRGIDFANLPNSANEIKNINTILSTANIKTDTLCGTSATEDSFKQLSGHSPDILHVATHGFYLDEESQKPFAQSVNTYSQKEAPMVLSGLALSGADIKWKGNFEDVNSEDGILTAYEISQLDLSNTKLVVLSACETARGKIFPVDGVFGLQRAFKQAGAGAILMSLWKVDDGVTAIFMEHFYKFLFETNDRHKALKLAQDEVKMQFPDPYYWAAWVMLD
ncbi:MAG: CHAT domain-containing protein, partial [Bacteroidales bacterium]|nr:CHAT domain-containing protein [Bacteroidales bacterium]